MSNKQKSIPMTDVKSSQVTHAGYDPESKMLAVTYKSGGTYHYSDVTQDNYDKLTKAKSFGKCMHENISGKHKHTKL